MSRHHSSATAAPETGITLHLSSSGLREQHNPEDESSVADQIIRTARLHRIAFREDPVLVEALIHYNVVESVPAELFGAVSEILLFLQRLETSKK